MKCFFANGGIPNFLNYIPVIDGGIGTRGLLAILGDGVIFPRPEISQASLGMCIPPTPDHHLDVITHADVFRFTDNLQDRYTPVLLKQQKESADILVLWAVNISYYTIDELIVPDGCIVNEMYHLTPGYMELLFCLKPGQQITCKFRQVTVTIGWDGTHLHNTSK